MPDRFATFAALLDSLYYEGHEVVDSLVDEFRSVHRWGGRGPAAIRFHARVSQQIHRIEDRADLHNAISIVLADVVDREGRDPSGAICPDVLGQLYGATVGSSVRTMLGSVGTHGTTRIRDAVTANELVRLVGLFAPGRVGELLAPDLLEPPLPLVDAVRERFGALDERVAAIVGVQHLMGSTVTLFRALSAGSVPPHRVFLLGKPYSTNHAVMRYLESVCGFAVHPGSVEYRGAREYHEEADVHIASLLSAAVASVSERRGRILLIDDGGRAIRMIHESSLGFAAERFACVEQTRRGVRELQGLSLRGPVVHVAESRVKLERESPIIGESVSDEVARRLEALEVAGIPVGRSSAILGFGAIGSAVASALRDRGQAIVVYDPDATKRDAARAAGYAAVSRLADALGAARVVIGCTGYAAMGLAEYELLQNDSILISASSSDIEFSGWHLRALSRASDAEHRITDVFNLVHERFRDRLLYLGDLDHPCHFLSVARVFGRRVFLVNGGFPINFTGGVDPIPPAKIQLTRALLFAAGVQSSRTEEPGLHPVDAAAQMLIERGWEGLGPA